MPRTSVVLWALCSATVVLSCTDDRDPLAPPVPRPAVTAQVAAPTSASLSLQAISDAIDALTASLLTAGARKALVAMVSTASALEASGKTKQAQAVLGAARDLVQGQVSGGTLSASQATPLLDAIDNAVAGGLSLVAVSAGEYHACGLSTDGQAWCWGHNAYGQLGDGTTTNRSVPAPVLTELRFTSLAAGGFHTCGITADAVAYCWGRNDFGQLGDGTHTSSDVPVRVQGEVLWSRVDAAYPLTCGLSQDGGAYCWGSNEHAGLGTSTVAEVCSPFGSTTPCSSTPVPVSGGVTFEAISTGLLSSCGLDASAAARCWGWGALGELGDGVKSGCPVEPGGRCAVTPSEVIGGSFTTVSAGGGFACGLTTAAEAVCWGFGEFGQLGDGTRDFTYAPVPVAGGHTFETIVASKGNSILGHACGLTSAGQAFCWGSDAYGQLGTSSGDICPGPSGISAACNLTPVPVDGGIAFASISAGNGFSCAIDVGRGTFCWGQNVFGELGNGSAVNVAMPTRVVAP